MSMRLPPALMASPLAGYLTEIVDIQPVAIGESVAQVYRLSDSHGPVSFLKVCPRDAPILLTDDADRLDWLADRLPVPRLMAYGEEETFTYLLMSAMPGVDAATLAENGQMVPARLVRLLAEGLRQFHAVPWADCPFDHRLAHELEQAQLRTERGQVDEEDFDAERHGQTAVALLEELLASVPADEDLVLTHGDYCLPNVMLTDNQVSGFIDLGLAGVGDRYRDLALARRSLIRNCGAAWVSFFFESYGLPQPDEAKLAFYQLLDEFY